MTYTENKSSTIAIMQTELLYKGLSFSMLGSLVVALAMVLIVGPYADPNRSWEWLAILLTVSLYRWVVNRVYQGLSEEEQSHKKWNLHFKCGAYAAAVVWGSVVWLFYPVNHPEYQVLIILGLAGVAGGALAVLSYDSKIIIYYQVILLVFIESRLLWENQSFSMEIAVLSLFYFGFLMKGGLEIGNNYRELINFRFDADKHNLALLSTTEEMAHIGYWQWDMKSPYVDMSTNLAKMCGVEQNSQTTIKSCLIQIHIDDRQRVKMAIESVIETGDDSTVEYRIKTRKDNNWVIMNQIIKRIDNSQGEQSVFGTVQDISVIKSAEKKIFNMAYFDELTGLANRNHFQMHLNEQVKHAKRKREKLAVLYIDLDGFKEINDTMGHDQGDEYLKIIAKKLKGVLREIDFIARLGGDEFCIVLDGVKDGLDVCMVADKCLALSDKIIDIGFQKINPQMSIGIAIYPEDGQQATTLLKAADTAMYSAKKRGKQSYAFYDPKMTSDSIARLELEADLKKALLNNEFELWYQPKISLASGDMTGVEALIRWKHPQRGFIMPDEFINIAEQNGLIHKIGEWVMNAACMQLQQWNHQNLKLTVAINISSSHFSSKDFPEKMESVINNYELSPGDIEVEITESQTRNLQEHTVICHQLHKKGIKVAIDDFGTGYSSLSVLKHLEIDTIKVDREFIRELPDEPSAALMVSTIVNMSLALGYNVVAEGVETYEQAIFLNDLGCPLVQGYYYSKPVPAENIEELVKKSFKLS